MSAELGRRPFVELAQVDLGNQMVYEGCLHTRDGRAVRLTIHLHDDGKILGGVITLPGEQFKVLADIQGNLHG